MVRQVIVVINADNLDDLGDNIAQSDHIGRGHLCDLGDDQHQTARWQLS